MSKNQMDLLLHFASQPVFPFYQDKFLIPKSSQFLIAFRERDIFLFMKVVKRGPCQHLLRGNPIKWNWQKNAGANNLPPGRRLPYCFVLLCLN